MAIVAAVLDHSNFLCRGKRPDGPSRFARERKGRAHGRRAAMTGDARRADFKSLMGKHTCSCSTICDCKSLLREYFDDPSAPYPGDKPHLLFRVRNPRNAKNPGRSKQRAMRQQIYDRAAALLRVENAENRDDIRIGIIHFPRDVIRHYNNDQSNNKPKNFVDYLLPSHLVTNSKLGVAFTKVDRFTCIGTTKEKDNPKCTSDNVCHCNTYINSPFVTRDRIVASIKRPTSERTLRSTAFSATRGSSMAKKEAVIQSNRAVRAELLVDKLEKDVSAAKEDASSARKELNSIKIILDRKFSRFSRVSANKHLQQQVHSLEEEVNSLKRAAGTLHVERESVVSDLKNVKQSDSESKKRLKKMERDLDNLKRGTADPLSTSEIKHLGLCRQSIIDKEWHEHFPLASRSLLNFESLSECLLYVSVLFPNLETEVQSLEKLGARKYVASHKYLTKLERCLLCRVYPKMGISDLQIGLIFGLKKSAVS